MMKNITYYSSITLLIFYLSVACGKQNVGGNTADILNDPKVSKFQMTWHGGGSGMFEGMTVKPGCLRVYEVRMLETPPREAIDLAGSEAQYGQIEFEDIDQTKFICGLKKSSERNVDPDIFFIDLNHNGKLEKDEFHQGISIYERLDKIHYGVMDIPLRDQNQSRMHRVYAWYGKYDDLYLVSHCTMQGRIRLGGKEVSAVLVDYNCDGRYDTTGGIQTNDRIGWDADGDGKIDWREQHYIGSYLVYGGEVFRVGCTPDGRTVGVVPVEVPVGCLQMPTKHAFVCLIGDEGPMNLRITYGAIDIPAGKYQVNYLYIEEPDDNGKVTQLSKSGRYFVKPWEISAGVTTTIDRDKCIITDADKRNYEASIHELRGEGPQPKIALLLGEPLGALDEFDTNANPAKLKDKRILLCFWDMQQRPSRYCILQLGKRAEQLREKDVAIIVVQASKMDKNALNEWLGKNNIPFTVGMVQGDEQKAHMSWGVMSLPWLILTDRQHIVREVGFGMGALDTKLAEVGRPAVKEEIEERRRSVAEREIERLGGAIVKASENGVNYTEVSLHGPPFRRQWTGGNWGARYLNDLANLRKLRIQNIGAFTDEGMKHLQGLRNLESLMLIQTGVSDAGLVYLKELVNLEFLSLSSNKFTDAGLEHIMGMTDLKSLRLDAAQITDEGLRRLKQSELLTRLEFLVLNRTRITDAGLAYLQGMKELKRLYLSKTQIGDEGISHLAKLSKLEGIILNDTNITDAGLAHLKGLGNLNMLYLQNTRVTDAGLEHLKGSAHLEQLWLGGTKITDAGLVHIRGLTNLQSLSLERTEVTDKGLVDLNPLTALNELFLQQTNVTIDGYENLKGALPECQIYWEEKKNNDSASTPETIPADLDKVAGLVKGPDGQPLSGVRVTEFQTDKDYTTDDDGKFISAFGPSNERRFFFAVDKRRKLVGNGSLSPGEKRVEIKLVPAKVISGIVTDPGGKPVARAQVAPLPMTCYHVLTDEQGRFDVAWSPSWEPGEGLCLMARHKALNLAALVDITKDTETMKIKLNPALVLTGTAEDPDGEPIPGAHISVSLIRNWGCGTPVKDAITNDKGRFKLHCLPQRQEYGIQAKAEGFWRNEITTGFINRTINQEEVGSIILKQPVLSVSGIVVHTSGKVVADIPVFLHGEGQPDLASKTDAEGKFLFEKVCRGPIEISAKNDVLLGSVQTEGGAKNVKLVIVPKFE